LVLWKRSGVERKRRGQQSRPFDLDVVCDLTWDPAYTGSRDPQQQQQQQRVEEGAMDDLKKTREYHAMLL